MFEFIQKLAETENAFPAADDQVVILCRRSTVVAGNADGSYRLPYWREVSALLPPENVLIRIGRFDHAECFAWEMETLPELPENLGEYQIRKFLFEFSADESMALCRARGLLHWRRQHRFCGCCQSALSASATDSGLLCPKCGSVYYPQLAPAVIVGITRNNDRELLLAHNRNFAGNMYSLIAGFVEAGETLEEAVRREVWEECSLRIKDLRYITSQVWPFPNSLMLAFHARYDSGTAEADGEELSDLGWFTAENHPELPAHGSVARQVIDQIFQIN